MPIQKFRAKPVVIEGIIWTGENFEEIYRFTNGLAYRNSNGILFINTTEGISRADPTDSKRSYPGDLIAKGTQGEFYPIKPRVVAAKYVEVIG